MKIEYKARFAKCKQGDIDNPVEPNQTMTVQEMLVMYSKGLELPDKIGEYDENPNIDEVGYSVGDRLDAVDYLNNVNRRLAMLKKKASEAKSEVKSEVNVETTSNVVE